MHPVLYEIIACKDAPRIDVLRRWQQQLRDIIHPLVQAGEIAQAMAEDTTRPTGRPAKAGK